MWSDQEACDDVLSFESDGREKLIEVKTTPFAQEGPLYVTVVIQEGAGAFPADAADRRLSTLGRPVLPEVEICRCAALRCYLNKPRAGIRLVNGDNTDVKWRDLAI